MNFLLRISRLYLHRERIVFIGSTMSHWHSSTVTQNGQTFCISSRVPVVLQNLTHGSHEALRTAPLNKWSPGIISPSNVCNQPHHSRLFSRRFSPSGVLLAWRPCYRDRRRDSGPCRGLVYSGVAECWHSGIPDYSSNTGSGCRPPPGHPSHPCGHRQ